jgi:hypothetical protein
MKFKYAAIILLTSFVGAPAAFSQQTQGSLGATSTGKIDLDLQVLDSVEINRLGDINLGSYGGANTGDLASSEAYCVYVDNDADEIMYTVKFAGAATGAAAASINKYGDASTSFKGSKLRDCNNADNAQLHIDISEQEIRNATTDTYQDTLILLVNPV